MVAAILGVHWQSFSGWARAEIGAAILVAVGCVGEMYWLFKKGPSKEAWLKHEEFERKKTQRERLFAFIVAFGVSVEVVTLIHSLKESGELNLQVQSLVSTNLVLRSNVAALEIKLQPRRISQHGRDAFIQAARSLPKGPVAVLVKLTAPLEAKEYAVQLCGLLKLAGYQTRPDNVLNYEETYPFMIPLNTSIEVVSSNGAPEYSSVADNLANMLTNIDAHVSVFLAGAAPKMPGLTDQTVVIVLEKPF